MLGSHPHTPNRCVVVAADAHEQRRPVLDAGRREGREGVRRYARRGRRPRRGAARGWCEVCARTDPAAIDHAEVGGRLAAPAVPSGLGSSPVFRLWAPPPGRAIGSARNAAQPGLAPRGDDLSRGTGGSGGAGLAAADRNAGVEVGCARGRDRRPGRAARRAGVAGADRADANRYRRLRHPRHLPARGADVGAVLAPTPPLLPRPAVETGAILYAPAASPDDGEYPYDWPTQAQLDQFIAKAAPAGRQSRRSARRRRDNLTPWASRCIPSAISRRCSRSSR